MRVWFFHHRLFANFIIYNGRVYIWESNVVRVKIICTLVQALGLCTGSMSDKVYRCSINHDHCTRSQCCVSVMPVPLFNPAKGTLLIL